MTNYEVQVVEPSAVAMLEDMERRKMIKLRPSDSKERFKELVRKIRSKGNSLSFDEITAEVEAVRSARFDLKNDKH